MKKLLFVAAIALLLQAAYIAHQRQIINGHRQIINALIDLNHDKSEYIDKGCQGQYQGSEELLPGEVSPQ